MELVEPTARDLILEGLANVDNDGLEEIVQRLAVARGDRIASLLEWDRPLLLAYIATGQR